MLRVLLRVLLLPLFLVLALLLCGIGFALRRRDDDPVMDDSLEAAEDPYDENDDWRRRWFADMTYPERLSQVVRWYGIQKQDVVNEVPFDLWLRERKVRRI